MQINVIHTDGRVTPYDANRAIEVINWACEGLEVDPDKLSRRLSRRFNADTTTEAIQNGLIRSAAELADLNYPDWLKVSGRLRMWDWRRKVKARRGYLYGDYPAAFEYLRSEGLYEGYLIKKFLDTYSANDIAEAGTWIDPERDMRFDISGADLLTARYLLEGELLQEMWLTQALLLSMLEPAHERMAFAHKTYDLLSLGKISLATPLMSNLRQADGSLSSCHIIDIDDSRESIFDNISQLAAMSANGGGVGVRISKVRARGSRIRKKKGASGGVCPWIKIINATIVATNQRGVRAGACTVGIDVWHADLLEYMDLRGDAGSEHTKARDILLQFIISDEFMRRVILDKDWYLVCPTEIENVFGYQLADMYGDEFTNAYHVIETYINSSAPPLDVVNKVSAKAIWKKMLMLLLETGTPYVAFKDRINALNPNKHEGIIGGVNLCVESYSLFNSSYSHCCILLSLVLPRIADDEMADVSRTAVRLLDAACDLTTSPTYEARAHVKRYRTIGVGVMGLADWLAIRHLKYQDLDVIEKLFEDICFYTTQASVELAEERGAYPAFPGSEWSKGLILGGRNKEWVSNNSTDPERWYALMERLVVSGIRNSHILATAPNSSTSLVQGTTASFLPVFSRLTIDKNGAGINTIVPLYIKEAFHFYQESRYTHPSVVVSAAATIQKWIDTGLSTELLFNFNEHAYGLDYVATAKDLNDVYMQAWREGLKTVYYVRSMWQDKVTEKSECHSCAS
jgi:ribonucleoside-diphosphate reductase alpha chain